MAKLLVSDDDPVLLGLVARVLEGAGHQVLTTAHADEVGTLAAEAGVEAIVLDVLMPEVSGFEVLEALRSDPRTAKIPILMLSGLSKDEDRVRGLRRGADDYLGKPFHPDELVLRVERLIQWRRPDDEPRAVATDPEVAGYLGRYRVLGVLGEGAAGRVYRGWDPSLERAVALKTVRGDRLGSEAERREGLGKLRREAITVARFNHPNIVAIYDLGSSGGTTYVAMELVEGMSLSRCLQLGGPLPAARAVPLAAAIARALAAAHAHGVIHRDLKPGNVLLGRDGSVKVSDFGFAYLLSSRDETGRPHGTPGYVPPEVLHDRPHGREGDLFELGATFYEALSGANPLAGQNLRETVRNTLEGRVRPLHERISGTPPEIERLVGELLSVDPERRPSAEAVVERLEGMIAAEGWCWSAEALPAADA